jgi:hypothetical protein
VIQRWWLDQYYNPYRGMCQLRLAREFDDMTKELTQEESIIAS